MNGSRASRGAGSRAILGLVLNKPLILFGVLLYSATVGALRLLGVIGDRGALILFGLMVVDLAISHWLLARRSKRR